MKKNLFYALFLSLFIFFIGNNVFADEVGNGWVYSNGATYYYNNGVMAKGVTKIDGKNYFFGCLTGVLKRGEFVDDTNGNKYYADKDGVIYQSNFYNIDGNTYYFDSNGIMLKGIQNINGKNYFLGYLTGILKRGEFVDDTDGNKYYADNSGVIYQNNFYNIGGNRYYFNNSGIMAKGVTEVNGKKYFFGCLTGIQKVNEFVDDIDGNTYYIGTDGVIYQNDFYNIGGNRYYFDNSGVMAKGITEVNGKKYFFGCLTGIQKVNEFVDDIDGNKYYAATDGVIYQNDFYNIGGNRYYFDNSGVMAKGITEVNGKNYFLGYLTGILKQNEFVNDIDGNTYYADSEGVIAKGITKINGKEYFLGYITGILKRNEFANDLDGKTYYTNSDGVLQKGVVNINGHDYFFGCITGIMKISEFVDDFDGNTYYTDQNGYVQKGITVINGKRYFFGYLTGILKKNVFVGDLNNNIYHTTSEGIIQTGDLEIDGGWYRFNQDGVMQNGWQTINGVDHYYYADGTMAKGINKIAGLRYLFDNDGNLVHRNIQLWIDVSYAQGEIDWKTLWSSGAIDGAVIRMGSGRTPEDAYFAKNIKAVKEYNIPYALYFFSYARTRDDAIKEAQYMVSLFNREGANPRMNVFYDIEAYSDMSAEQYQEIIEAFKNYANSCGIGVSVYANKNFAQNKFNDTTRSYVEWIAHYTGDTLSGNRPVEGNPGRVTDYIGSWRLWQYTSNGYVPGINGNVDKNVVLY